MHIFDQKRQRVIVEEITKLLDADVIFEIDYLKWLANVVLVRKHNEKWRVFIDYMHRLKQGLPEGLLSTLINQIIDTTSGHALLSFLNAFSRYN